MAGMDVAPVSTYPRRVVLRPLGTPLPLGFLGLMVATAAFAAVQLGWVAPDQGRFAGYAALLFTAPVQLLAAVLGFLTRDPVAGTGMGVLLFLAGVALLVPAAAAMRKLVVAGVIGLSAVRFALTGVAMTTGVHAWLVVAGWWGLLLALVSLYAALALELEGAQRREVLPLLRRGTDAEEVAAHEEPGVREEL